MNYTYGDTNHKHAVTQMGSDTFAYDNNGNQITRNVGTHIYTLSYDAENRLVGVSGYVTAIPRASGQAFVYDGDGNRVKGIIGGVTTAYLGNYFEWTGSTTTMNVIPRYYYAGSRTNNVQVTTRVAERSGSSTMNYLFGDHSLGPRDRLGSQTAQKQCRRITRQVARQAITANNDGTKTGEIRYYAWGTERYTWGTTPTTFHYTGQRLESYINLYWYGSRWFDPALGRFIQPDSIIPNQNDSQSWDRYCYTSNNPVRYTDPSGHCPWCLVGAIVGAALGYGVQVYNNYNNGLTGIDAWTQNISAEPIIGGAVLGATVVAAVPVVVSVAGEVLIGTGAAIGSAEVFGIGTTTYAASQALENITYGIPNSANVCRGGTCQASQFSGGTGVVQDADGTLSNVSVTSAGGRSVETLSAGYPNRSVGVTTAGTIRQAGGSIYPSPILPDNPYHATIDGLTANKLQELLTPTIRNPNIPQ